MNSFQPKDNFSIRSEKYSLYRPVYPPALYDWLLLHVKGRGHALDCGTGNGQVAVELAKYFIRVSATDISENQLRNAVLKDNIHYRQEPAEKTSFPDQSFDLIAVSQAIHWFNFELFYKEVIRLLKPGGMFVVLGYGLIQISEEADKLIQHFYNETLGEYWDPERSYIDADYKTISFPFIEIEAPVFKIEVDWSLEQCIGFFETWSAVQHFIKANQYDPVQQLRKEISAFWKPNEIKKVSFPVLLRMANLN